MTTGEGAGAQRCEFLDWDSGFFGLRIARLHGSRLTVESGEAVAAWCRKQVIDCLYFFADPGDAETVQVAERQGYTLVDVRVTLASRLRAAHLRSRREFIREVQERDVPCLREIARVSHTETRFYFDRRFPRSRCDALYETWIVQSCHGQADTVLVADVEGRASGYLTCHLRGAEKGQIGLVGVHADARGRGLGGALVDAALEWFASRDVTEVSVVTQARNVGAIKLYERCGFQVSSVELGYHQWSTRQAP